MQAQRSSLPCSAKWPWSCSSGSTRSPSSLIPATLSSNRRKTNKTHNYHTIWPGNTNTQAEHLQIPTGLRKSKQLNLVQFLLLLISYTFINFQKLVTHDLIYHLISDAHKIMPFLGYLDMIKSELTKLVSNHLGKALII